MAYALAVEKLAGQAVPDRTQYLRIILAELTRLVNHSCLVGFLFNDPDTRHAIGLTLTVAPVFALA